MEGRENGEVSKLGETVESLQSKMGDVFWRNLFVRVAYLQGERRRLLGSNEAELLRTYPSKLPFIL